MTAACSASSQALHEARRIGVWASYVLHYATAREAYNLARAAADRAAGDLYKYRDAYAPQYLANARPAGTIDATAHHHAPPDR